MMSFITHVIGPAISLEDIFNSFGGIPSDPTVFFGFVLHNSLLTSLEERNAFLINLILIWFQKFGFIIVI